MSVKKQIPSLCKLYSFYEEIPEEFLDQTDVDSYSYHNILDNSQSLHRLVRVSKGSNKKSFAFKVFHFCDSKLQQRFFLQEEVSISKQEIESHSTAWVNFSKPLIKPTNYRRFHYQSIIWDSIYKSKRRTVQSLLQKYSWAFEQTNSIIVPVW